MNVPSLQPAATIAEVLDQLDTIIEWSKANNSRLGYFPALYRMVTARIAEGIRLQEFEDNTRMEKLDVVFANRYVEALAAYLNGKPCTLSWKISFQAANNWWPLVMQHLLMGMNAHISLDLGIAAAEIADPQNPEALKADFYKINTILAELTEGVQDDLGSIWPPLRLIDKLAGRADEQIAGFSMEYARNKAWEQTLLFAASPREEWPGLIAIRDARVVKFGRKILSPGFVPELLLAFIRISTTVSTKEVIDILTNE